MSSGNDTPNSKNTQLAMFDDGIEFTRRIRRTIQDGVEYFSLVDMMVEFSDTKAAKQYWNDTKKRLAKDGFQLSENILRLKLPSSDGKFYLTDVAVGEVCLRIVESIPSPKAEPIRRWLSGLGYREILETKDPLSALSRVTRQTVEHYMKRGMSLEEAIQHVKEQHDTTAIRNEMTEVVQQRVTGDIRYGVLTDEEYLALFMRRAKEIREQTGYSNARHGMTTQGLAFVRIVESTFIDILKTNKTITFEEACEIMRNIALPLGVSVREIEQITSIDLATGKRLLKSHYDYE